MKVSKIFSKMLCYVTSRLLRCFFFFFSSRRRHTRCSRDWSSDVCSSDLEFPGSARHHHGDAVTLLLQLAHEFGGLVRRDPAGDTQCVAHFCRARLAASTT